ncbi:MAG: hypothetical protein JEY99_13270 [Spirochaetales bacterium]|nr:hypothetical protein [Spirochaetales bacterium]
MNDYHKIPTEDLPFHYNREERLGQASEEVRNTLYAEGKKRVILDKRLLIIMIDIVIVVIAFIGVTAYQKSLARVGNFEGVKLALVAIEYDGQILASLKVENLAETEPGRIIEAAFFLKKGEEVVISDLIPASVGGKRVLRETLKPESGFTSLNVRVRIGDNERILKKQISGE